MKPARQYCGRPCYRQASRKYETRKYPEIWHEGKQILYHHYVWLMANPGKTIEPGEIIHHRDGNPFNRAPSNLEKLTRAEHINRHRDENGKLVSLTPEQEADIDFWIKAARGATPRELIATAV
jgi:hypothetical protein